MKMISENRLAQMGLTWSWKRQENSLHPRGEWRALGSSHENKNTQSMSHLHVMYLC